MYKAKIDKMIEDSKENFEFKVFKECKTVKRILFLNISFYYITFLSLFLKV